MNIIKFLNRGFSRFGYELVARNELDKITYRALGKAQEKAPEVMSATEMKINLLNTFEIPIIFDVGAYVGQTAEQYLATFPKAIIHAFEPTEASFAQLKGKFKDNPAIICNKLAISDHDGELTFNVNDFAPTNSTLATHSDAGQYWGDKLLNTNHIVTVGCTKLDSYCLENGIERINLLKIDVQGADLSVLSGAENMLTDKKIDAIYLEVIYVPTYVNQSRYYEIEKCLDENGYELVGVFNLAYSDNRVKQADLLFRLSS